MSKLYYRNRALLFVCDRKRCGDKCNPECRLTTDIEHAADKCGEYDVSPAVAAQDDMYYIAVPVKGGREKKVISDRSVQK